MQNNNPKYEKGVILTEFIDFHKVSSTDKVNLIVLIKKPDRIYKARLVSWSHDECIIKYSNQSQEKVKINLLKEFVLSDVATQEKLPIVKSQYNDIIFNNLDLNIRDYKKMEYDYGDNNIIIRAKVVFDSIDIINKATIEYEMPRALMLQIIDVLHHPEQIALRDFLKKKYRLTDIGERANIRRIK